MCLNLPPEQMVLVFPPAHLSSHCGVLQCLQNQQVLWASRPFFQILSPYYSRARFKAVLGTNSVPLCIFFRLYMARHLQTQRLLSNLSMA